jgi:hypothetical protein
MLILRIAKLHRETNPLRPLQSMQRDQRGIKTIKQFQMRGIFWNSNELKDLKKHKFISDLTKEHDLNFITLSGRSDFGPRFLKNLSAGRDFLWHAKALVGRFGGMLLGIDL